MADAEFNFKTVFISLEIVFFFVDTFFFCFLSILLYLD